jgi:hypothetical protein
MKYTAWTLVLAASFLTGCSSDDYDIKLKGINGKTDVQLINASQVPLDYHIGSFNFSGNAPDIKAQKYRVGTLEAGQDQLQVKVEHNWADERLSVQAFHRLTAQGSEYLQHKSDVGKDLTLVAWQDGPQVRLSIFRKSTSSQNGLYRLRILATADEVSVQAVSVTLQLKKGELSPWLSLNHCQGELRLNAQAVDVCKATAGQSFLVVTDKTTILSLTQS